MIRLVTNPSDLALASLTSLGGAKAQLNLSFKVYDDDPSLPQSRVVGKVEWGDGKSSTPFGPTPATSGTPLSVSLSRLYLPGTYQVVIEAANLRNPKPDTTKQLIFVVVSTDQPETKPENFVVVGPILPRDQGRPGPDTWMLDSSGDTILLASSVKSILLTRKGDRVMLPEYGTNLSRLVFEHDPELIATMASNEISTAISKWEPRVELEGVSASVEGSSVYVDVRLRSKLNRSSFTVSTTINQ